ncbi:glycoside hydrolase family 108 protein [Novosphingobium sp. FSW06-99]|uniref:glycoside hydrolase family 108 protein n=1 Tax=Novosphingobium sp. FSW06-99 TaxID=1739113 RepID=UPI00076CCED3|nr:glycosyl hydrolase 108 family protein [Novosphingobium sp. FSW06-99]KUR80901.1 hypothetical protein AQZ49_02440 [Novosphingobium sp. FSW06-99]
MTHTFADALPVVLTEEGGFVDDPRDPGGTTDLGITAAVWASWSGEPATEAVMHSLTPEKVTPLYKAWFWDKVAGEKLPDGLNLCVFDFAVNGGVSRAAKMLQQIVGASQDGMIGPGTLVQVGAYMALQGGDGLVSAYSEARRTFYRADPRFSVFGTGWLNRVAHVEQVALSWLA